jgi:hypothetical protein
MYYMPSTVVGNSNTEVKNQLWYLCSRFGNKTGDKQGKLVKYMHVGKQ